MPFGGDEPVGIGTIAFCHTVRVVSGKQVRISAEAVEKLICRGRRADLRSQIAAGSAS